jgi:hypothetical protein
MRNPQKLLEKSKKSENNSQEILVLLPLDEKSSIKIYSEEDFESSPKKPMLARWVLWKISLQRMRNPQKLLEKSKNLKIIPRKFWSYYPLMKNCSIKIYSEEGVVSSPKMLVEFCGKFLHYACKSTKIA